MEQKTTGWTYLNEQGSFRLEHPEHTNYLYFPLVNEAGMMSAVTPNLHGSATTGHNTFLLPPVSVEDLHNSRASRNFWVHVHGEGAWSATGFSARHQAERFHTDQESSAMEAGFLWHRLIRESRSLGLRAEITSVVPPTDDAVELMKVTLRNVGDRVRKLTPTAAIPVYGRSADDLRDHRHVTSLLHRTQVSAYGVDVQPSLSFDERGHRVNEWAYRVLGADGSGQPPLGCFPAWEDFIGEGGSLPKQTR